MRRITIIVFGLAAAALLFTTENRSGDNRSDEKWKAALVNDDEPGEPMIVSGTVYAPDGETALAGIRVHVYHTDARGYYSKDGKDESQHRIRATMITDAEGKYEFRTIKPASYPNNRIPAHVHYVVSGDGIEEQRFELRFEGDRYLSDREKAVDSERGRFGHIKPLVKDADGVLRCEFNIKVQRK
jgi:protocatechuate 3,4-dioxygenase beta subunit